MYVVARRYTAAPELMDALAQGTPEIEHDLRAIRGFRAYYFIRSGAGGLSITVCDDHIGAQESNLLAADWISEHAPTAPGNVPEVIEGEALIAFGP
jgi:hypothetical protein